MNQGPSKSACRAFTLVELLIAICIIALLTGVLLPSLNKARRASRTIRCLANLHSIGQAMIAYTAENKGWLPGSGWTSGAMFWNFSTFPPSPAISNPPYSVSYSPGLNESNDWIGPLARQMGIKDAAIDGNDDVARYQAYRNLQWMICPAYGDMPVPASSNSDADAGTGQGLSYCTALIFLDRAWETFSAIGQTRLNGNLVLPADATGHRGIVTLPTGYAPRITHISACAAKIFAADGARTVLPVVSDGQRIEQPPVYIISANPAVTNWDNTSYADYGAFGGWSHSFYRTAVPGNSTNAPSQDLRVWAYRHGSQSAFQSAGSYRMNVVYFDGHAETLDDVTAANPALWMPRGSVIYPAAGCGAVSVKGTKTVWSDVLGRYCPGVAGINDPWISP